MKMNLLTASKNGIENTLRGGFQINATHLPPVCGN
jgi:hypothetical protein